MTKYEPRLGIKRGKTDQITRAVIKILSITGLSLREIRKELKTSFGIDMKEPSIRTWTNYNYKKVRYAQNRNRYK